jgi:hypothetical protein
MNKRELLWWLVFGASSLATIVGIVEGFEKPSSVVVFLAGPVLMVTLSGVFLLGIIPQRRDGGK